MEPITTELRKLMAHTVDGFDLRRPLVECDRAEFERLCDQIDAVHESLERENDSLRIELARTIGELDEMHKSGEISNNPTIFMHSGMSITHGLREWAHGFNGPWKRNEEMLLAIADRIDAEHQKAIRELNNLADASVLLPVDADGEVIHVGDAMEHGKARGRVIALMLSNYPKKWGGALHWGIQLEGEHAPTALDLTFHHYHEPTVEDVLREFTDAILEWSGKSGTVAEVGTWSDVAAEYVAKLRLAEGEDA